jgi:thiol-disulfide isomerase/thioredoxin
LKKALTFPLLLLAVASLAACSNRGVGSDLAVAKIPVAQLQATNYLPLNDDKPGTPLDVRNYLVPGKYTIVFFFSRYDPTCQNLEPQLAQLAQTQPNLAVRTVNINRPEVQAVDWQSPVVQQMEIRSLPYIQIYEPSLALRAQGRPAYTQVCQWVQPAR